MVKVTSDSIAAIYDARQDVCGGMFFVVLMSSNKQSAAQAKLPLMKKKPELTIYFLLLMIIDARLPYSLRWLHALLQFKFKVCRNPLRYPSRS